MTAAGDSAPRALASYDPVARGVHWAVAGLAILAVSLGLAIPEAPRGTQSREWLLILHRSIGLTILALMVFRAFWRGRRRPPSLHATMRPIEVLAAHATHWLLYAAFLLMPIAGYLNSAAAGHAVSFFGLFAIPPLVPEDPRLAQAAIAVHLVLQFAVYLLVGMHVAAALMHLWVRRDEVFDRMLPRRAPRP